MIFYFLHGCQCIYGVWILSRGWPLSTCWRHSLHGRLPTPFSFTTRAMWRCLSVGCQSLPENANVYLPTNYHPRFARSVCLLCLNSSTKLFFRWENALKNELQLNFWFFAPSSNGRRDSRAMRFLFLFFLFVLTLVSFFSLCANRIPVGDW